jgi:protein gp37
MAENSKIQWTHNTFNCWRGCSKVSAGCTNCYAETQSVRNPVILGEWGPRGTRVLAAEAQWRAVLRWNALAERARVPTLVFCCSFADVFEDWPGQMTDAHERPLWVNTTSHEVPKRTLFEIVQGEFERAGPHMVRYGLGHARARLWDTIRATPWLRWQLLTKRPENIRRMMPHGDWPNVWLGVSVENQEHAWRLDALADAREVIHCPVGFMSAEPLLGPIDTVGGADWVIIGAESGSGARDCRLEWIRSLVKLCRSSKVACFVKQLGHRPLVSLPVPGGDTRLHLLDKKGGDMAEFPPECRVREYPKCHTTFA